MLSLELLVYPSSLLNIVQFFEKSKNLALCLGGQGVVHMAFKTNFKVRALVIYPGHHPKSSGARFHASQSDYSSKVAPPVNCLHWVDILSLFSFAVNVIFNLLPPCKQTFTIQNQYQVRCNWATSNPTIFNIIRWVAGLIVSSTKCLMVQVLF